MLDALTLVAALFSADAPVAKALPGRYVCQAENLEIRATETTSPIQTA